MAQLDILQMLAEFLCWGNRECMQLFTRYEPLEGLLYLVFFPTVFLILLVYLITRHISPHTKFNILLGIAFYTFIIVQGWYGWIAKFAIGLWYVLVIILFGIWVVFKMFFPGREAGGAPRQRITAFQKLGKQIGDRAWKRISGEEERLKREARIAISEIRGIEKGLKEGDTYAWHAFGTVSTKAHALLNELESMTQVAGFTDKSYRDIEEELRRAIERIEKIERKH